MIKYGKLRLLRLGILSPGAWKYQDSHFSMIKTNESIFTKIEVWADFMYFSAYNLSTRLIKITPYLYAHSTKLTVKSFLTFDLQRFICHIDHSTVVRGIWFSRSYDMENTRLLLSTSQIISSAHNSPIIQLRYRCVCKS